MRPRAWLLSGLLALAACGKGTSGWVLSGPALAASGAAGAESGAIDDGGNAGQIGGSVAGTGGSAGTAVAGARCPTRFASVCAPSIVVDNKDAAGSGKLFTAAFDDPSTALSCVLRDVCDILYRKASEIKNVTKVSLIVEDYDGVSEAWSPAPGEGVIHLSSRHLQQVSDARGDVSLELSNILYYHATNTYQFDGGDGTTNSWLVSGVANYVRHVAGYVTDGQRKAGGAYNDGGLTTGFFFVWLDQKYPDLVYELNLSLDPSSSVPWTTKAFQDITAESVDMLWASYQATL
ncbi:MAG TPA: basic secretory protein-like protein [Polyangiaceae bacterium]